MAKDISEDVFKRNWVMDRTWMSDKDGNVHEGEAIMLAMLLKVKKSKNRTSEQEAELQEILEKPKAKKKK